MRAHLKSHAEEPGFRFSIDGNSHRIMPALRHEACAARRYRWMVRVAGKRGDTLLDRPSYKILLQLIAQNHRIPGHPMDFALGKHFMYQMIYAMEFGK